MNHLVVHKGRALWEVTGPTSPPLARSPELFWDIRKSQGVGVRGCTPTWLLTSTRGVGTRALLRLAMLPTTHRRTVTLWDLLKGNRSEKRKAARLPWDEITAPERQAPNRVYTVCPASPDQGKSLEWGSASLTATGTSTKQIHRDHPPSTQPSAPPK